MCPVTNPPGEDEICEDEEERERREQWERDLSIELLEQQLERELSEEGPVV